MNLVVFYLVKLNKVLGKGVSQCNYFIQRRKFQLAKYFLIWIDEFCDLIHLFIRVTIEKYDFAINAAHTDQFTIWGNIQQFSLAANVDGFQQGFRDVIPDF